MLRGGDGAAEDGEALGLPLDGFGDAGADGVEGFLALADVEGVEVEFAAEEDGLGAEEDGAAGLDRKSVV